MNISKINYNNLNFIEINEIINNDKNYYQIDKINWENYSNKVDVTFKIFHYNKGIIIKFYVNDSFFVLNNLDNNSPVYRDSCVEFFISFDNTHYYNFEFNGVGTILAQYGENRFNRVFLTESELSQVKTFSSLKKEITPLTKNVNWELLIIIPTTVFKFDEIENIKNKKAFCNFYKCGDDLPNKHYLTFFPVKTEKPDFHQLPFFGSVYFE